MDSGAAVEAYATLYVASAPLQPLKFAAAARDEMRHRGATANDASQQSPTGQRKRGSGF